MNTQESAPNNNYFGGIPTEPDVKKIRETYPEEDLEIGEIVKYEEIEKLINVNRKSHRFKGVTNHWRKAVFDEKNILIAAERGIGFKKLSEGEKVGQTSLHLRKAGRAVNRSYVIIGKIDTRQLSEEQRRQLDHNQTISSKILSIQNIKKIGESK